jgi:hypothetical protein
MRRRDSACFVLGIGMLLLQANAQATTRTVTTTADHGGILEANDNWIDSANKQAIIDSTIPPANDSESAIVRTLSPANYTAIVRGSGGTTGIAVVEVYALN